MTLNKIKNSTQNISTQSPRYLVKAIDYSFERLKRFQCHIRHHIAHTNFHENRHRYSSFIFQHKNILNKNR